MGGPDQGGFSLIEMMIALALSAIVMAGAGTMLLQAYANESAYREQNDAQRNARTALDTVTEDLREARNTVGFPRDIPPYYPTSSNPLKIQTWDNSTEPITIRYWLADPTLQERTQDPAKEGTMILWRQVKDSGGRETRLTAVARNLRRPDGSPPFSVNPIYKEGLPATLQNLVGTSVIVAATVGDDPSDPNDSYSTMTMRSDVTMRNYLF